ncbi:unnamed protein product, partial [Anisakis simplex]|uniref:Uncharacterized protein n=1 Tax=Anisakis simplex TaxID=6269 RepID=A0A0M3J0F6_ANISI
MWHGRATAGGGSRRRRRTRRTRHGATEEDVTVECDDKRVKNPRTKRKRGRAVSASVAAALANFVEDVKTLGLAGMRKEFEELRSFSPSNNEQTAFKANPKNNRYLDVPCLDA